MSTNVLADSIQAYGMELRRLQRGDIELVRQWRNHPDVSRHMLSAEHITREQQVAWFEQVSNATDRAIYLAYYKGVPTAFASVTCESGHPIGESEEMEAAIYLAPESPCRGNLLAFAPALALNDACFGMLHCQCLVAKVRRENDAALRFNTQMGYQETGRDDELIYLELERTNYENATRQVKGMLCRPTSAVNNKVKLQYEQ
jgi:diamine N-acetyltransferase